jgi:hypothetical protein
MATASMERQQYGQQHAEGTIARTIEQQTAKLPSDVFLWSAVASMTASLTLRLMGHQHVSLFVGQWAPTFHPRTLQQDRERARLGPHRPALNSAGSRLRAAPGGRTHMGDCACMPCA